MVPFSFIIGTLDDKQAQFLPFHAIDQYMLPDYRLHVIQAVFSGFDRLPGEPASPRLMDW